jgi:hypothetical protein
VEMVVVQQPGHFVMRGRAGQFDGHQFPLGHQQQQCAVDRGYPQPRDDRLRQGVGFLRTERPAGFGKDSADGPRWRVRRSSMREF